MRPLNNIAHCLYFTSNNMRIGHADLSLLCDTVTTAGHGASPTIPMTTKTPTTSTPLDQDSYYTEIRDVDATAAQLQKPSDNYESLRPQQAPTHIYTGIKPRQPADSGDNGEYLEPII